MGQTQGSSPQKIIKQKKKKEWPFPLLFITELHHQTNQLFSVFCLASTGSFHLFLFNIHLGSSQLQNHKNIQDLNLTLRQHYQEAEKSQTEDY